jgi:four helix bundle protein
MKIEKFEDIKVWQDSRCFVNQIYKIIGESKIKNDYTLKDQIQGAALSIMNNIAEGFERNNNKEYIRFLQYSKASAGEVRSMLLLAKDLNYITQEQFTGVYEDSLNLGSQLSNFMKYLRTNLKSRIK